MPEIQTPDPARKLQDRYDLAQPSTPFLSPELVPVVIVDNLAGEDALEASFERAAFAFEDQVPAAGQVARILFQNASAGSGSGVVAFMERVVVWTSGAVVGRLAVELQPFNPNLNPPLGTFKRFRDTRVQGVPACGLNVASLAPPLVLDQQWVIDLDPQPRSIIPLPEVITPGFRLFFTHSIPNETLFLQLWWRERNLTVRG